MKVPGRHGAVGWFDYRPTASDFYLHLYWMSRSDADLARLEERCPEWKKWRSSPGFFKGGGHSALGWFAYIMGKNPQYPDEELDATYQGICQRLEQIENDDDDVESWDVHHWQNLNPVVPEGIVQMAMGTPAAVYHGGLIQASVRYFDPARCRPGLPRHVAALVDGVTPEGIGLTLVNTDPQNPRRVLVQAGAFGEHRFGTAKVEGQKETVVVDAPYFEVELGPAAQMHLEVGLQRFAQRPTFEFPPLE